MSGWKTTLLVGALALSLLGNALAVGAGLRLYHMRQGLLGDSAAMTLPRDERRALMRALVSHETDLRPALDAVRTARAEAVAAVTARPYDATKADAALDQLRSALEQLMQQAQSVVLDDLAQRKGG